MSNDKQAHRLAKGYGAAQLIDKMKLLDDLIPAIMVAFAGSKFNGNLN